MITFKCKMCGGDLEITDGSSICECPYCGTQQTLPKADDDQRANRYNRANHFRRQNEFDKAISAYEKILEENDEDAEAHWGVVLSRFGIEYVEDPNSHKRIPTCHRVQIASILADEDYQAAVKYAPDTQSRQVYEQQATEIAEIQKRILAVSQNEKPYDVFICYKETDEHNQRTRDSALAQEVYYGLTEQGYKVFFSRITLEDKLGQEYEPYIFAALHSAKVMVVIGTKPEYFNAVWVKNEWRRYLAIMANDRHRLLIPCYRDMDPYDLPEELSNLQSQDMSRIGFIQDLLRGVKKVLDDGKNQGGAAVEKAAQTAPATGTAAPGITSLMERTYLFMEDGDFKSASEYLDRVLDIDPKYAPAYVAKACVSFGIRKEAGLAVTTFLYEDNADWQKAMRFANSQQKRIYEGYINKAREKVNKQIHDYAMDCATAMAVCPGLNKDALTQELERYKAACSQSGKGRGTGSRRTDYQKNEAAYKVAVQSNEPGDVSEQQLKSAAAMFEAVQDEMGRKRAQECRRLAEQARQKAIYQQASSLYKFNRFNSVELDHAEELFQSILKYRDAGSLAQKCKEQAENNRNDLYNKAVNAMNAAGQDSAKWESACKALAESALNNYRDINEQRERAAHRRDECLAAEAEVRRQKEEIARKQAAAAAAKKKRMTAIVIGLAVICVAAVVLVTQVIIPNSKYQAAKALQESGKYEEAITAYEALNGYSDSADQINACKNSILEREYQAAKALQESGKYEEAITAYEALNGYSDSADQINACKNGILEREYQAAKALQESGKYEEAIIAYEALNGYSDSEEQIKECNYQHAIALQEAGKYDEAYAKYMTISGYKDVDNIVSDENLVAAAAAAAREAKLAPYKTVGSIVTFGQYEQDNNKGNGQEEIEWIVLDVQDGKSLLLSRYGLDKKPYNTKYTNITWEQCTLRLWLNEEFLQTAFSEEEQSAILTTEVDNSKAQGYSGWSTDGGINTQDRIFLLSYAEANKYLGVTYDDSNNQKSRVAPTSWAKAQGAWISDSNKTTDGEPAGWWWLRSPGLSRSSAATVTCDGSLSSSSVGNDDGVVRPAFWINLESGIF